MEYNEFLQSIRQFIENKLGNSYHVQISRVLKNNGIELDGLIILKEGEKISPSLYLNLYFSEYKKGKSIEWIAEELIKNYQESLCNSYNSNLDFRFSFAEIKKFIIFRLVNYNKNKKLLEGLAYIRFLDLAITFHCLVKQENEEISTLRITKELMETWETSTKELMKLASKNTPYLLPPCIRTMNEVIKDILKQEMKELFWKSETNKQELEEDSDVILEEILNSGKKEDTPIYILTNSKGVYGAAALLYKNVLKDFVRHFQSDFYILPSSIHEVILIPITNLFNKESLIDMVLDVNCTQVPVEDVLSNQVYIYHYATNSFEL